MDQRGRQCEKCGYDLTGIKGLQGTCPECGAYWDVMSGKGLTIGEPRRASRHDKLMARLRTISLGLFSLFMVTCGGLGAWFAQHNGGNPLRPLAIAGLIAVVGVMATLTSYFHEES